MNNERQCEYAAFVLRVSLGTMFVAHGLLKTVVFTLPGTAQFFDAVGFPGWMAYPVAYGEIVGGTLLIAGIWTRVIAIGLLPVLLGAAYVHAGNGWVFSNPNGGWEYAIFLAAASVAQIFLGSGAFALRLRNFPIFRGKAS